MESVLAIALALIQSAGEMPAEVKAARLKLEKAPDDAKANQTVGLYLLARRDPAAVEHLKKASDSALKRAATLEAEDPLKAAKAWYNTKSYPAKERAALCVEKLWTSAQDRDAIRPKLAEFAAPPAGYQKYEQKASAAGWWPLTDEFGSGVDSRFAWTGSKSLKLLPTKGGKGNPDGWASAHCLSFPVGQAKRVTASIYLFCYDTDFGGQFNVYFTDGLEKRLGAAQVAIIPDQPFWKRYEVSADVPPGTLLASMRIDCKITKGAVWCDEVNMTDGSRDLFMGGGLER
jgi:hypothetical protein